MFTLDAQESGRSALDSGDSSDTMSSRSKHVINGIKRKSSIIPSSVPSSETLGNTTNSYLEAQKALLPNMSPLSQVVLECVEPGVFAFTFDGGPSKYTSRVLNAFAEVGKKATFHATTDHLTDVMVSANLKRAVREGHLIGLVTTDGGILNDKSTDEILQEIAEKADLLKRHIAIPYDIKFIRIPNHHELSQDKLEAISELYIVTSHNMDSCDYDAKNMDQIVANVSEPLDELGPNTKGSFIFVQRDSEPISADATDKILDTVMSRGYEPVTLDRCVGYKYPGYGKNSCKDNKKKNTDSSTKKRQADSSAEILTSSYTLSILILCLMTVIY